MITPTKEQWVHLNLVAKYKTLVALFPTIKYELVHSSEKIMEAQLDIYFEDYILNSKK